MTGVQGVGWKCSMMEATVLVSQLSVSKVLARSLVKAPSTDPLGYARAKLRQLAVYGKHRSLASVILYRIQKWVFLNIVVHFFDVHQRVTDLYP